MRSSEKRRGRGLPMPSRGRRSSKAITDADRIQEQQRARAPLSTQDRNRTANRILEAVARIAGAGGLEFDSDPEARAAFRALKPPPKSRKVAAKRAPEAPSLNA